MRRLVVILCSIACVVGCATSRRVGRAAAAPTAADWAGVYATPAARGDGAARLLVILLADDADARPVYRMIARDAAGGALDVVGAGRIDGDTIVVALATAAVDDESGDVTRAVASVERYHFRRVAGRAVLISDEALATLGDDDATIAGLMIKVSDRPSLPDPSVTGGARPIERSAEWVREVAKAAKKTRR